MIFDIELLTKANMFPYQRIRQERLFTGYPFDEFLKIFEAAAFGSVMIGSVRL